MKAIRVATATVFLCAQLASAMQVLAQTVPSAPAAPTPGGQASFSAQATSKPTSANVPTSPPPPPAPTALPAKAVITPAMISGLANIVDFKGLNVIDVSKVGGMVQPNGVVNVNGTLSNAGNLFLVSTSPAVQTATLNANSIWNQPGATISTVIPQSGLNGYAASNFVSGLHLNIVALQSIFNAGTISSAGSLSATAGISIINAPIQTAALTAIPAPVMQAMQNVNLQAPNIANSGLIASQLANISIANSINSNLIVNSLGGTIQALAGKIDITNALNTTLSGGRSFTEPEHPQRRGSILSKHRANSWRIEHQCGCVQRLNWGHSENRNLRHDR